MSKWIKINLGLFPKDEFREAYIENMEVGRHKVRVILVVHSSTGRHEFPIGMGTRIYSPIWKHAIAEANCLIEEIHRQLEEPLVVKRITKSTYEGYAVYEIGDGYNPDDGIIVLTDTIGRFNVGDKLDLIRK